MGTLEVSNSGCLKFPTSNNSLWWKSTPISLINSRGLWTLRGKRSVHRPAICISEARIRDVPLGADPAANHDHLPSGDSRDRKFDSYQSWFGCKTYTHICVHLCCWHNRPTHMLHIWSDESEALRFLMPCWWMRRNSRLCCAWCMAGSCISTGKMPSKHRRSQRLFKKRWTLLIDSTDPSCNIEKPKNIYIFWRLNLAKHI